MRQKGTPGQMCPVPRGRTSIGMLVLACSLATVSLYYGTGHVYKTVTDEDSSHRPKNGCAGKILCGETGGRNRTFEVLKDRGEEFDIPLGAISPSLTNYTTPEFLPNYRNRCWKEHLPDGDLYQNNFYVINEATRSPFKVLNQRWEQIRAGPAVNRWRFRCLPYFYIVGVAKTGTTDIYFKMAEHPDVTPSMVKETHWWTRRRIGLNGRAASQHPVPFDDFVSLSDLAAVHIMTSERNHYHHMVTGEASVTTLWYNEHWMMQPGNNRNMTEPKFLNAHYLHAVQPDAKIIISLRQPSERLWSDYLFFNFDFPAKSKYHFDEMCNYALPRVADCVKGRGLRNCVYNSTFNADFQRLRVRISMYYAYIRDWLEVFPRDQILVVRFEDYIRDRVHVLNAIFGFLGLPPLPASAATRVSGSSVSNPRWMGNVKKGNMLPQTRKLLDQFYRPYNELLSDLLKDKKFLW